MDFLFCSQEVKDPEFTHCPTTVEFVALLVFLSAAESAGCSLVKVCAG